MTAYCQAFLHGLKFLQAEGCASTDQTQWQVRGYINKYQRDAECHRAKSWQELSAKNKWLHWEEVIEVVRCQREEYESETRPDVRAALSQDYAQLLLYTSLPPGRAEEYRTLQLKLYTGSETVCPATTSTEPKNILHMSENGSEALLQIGKHKTVSSAGRQLIDLRSTDDLVAHLLDYIHKDRPLLLQGREDHDYLFMVSHSQHSIEKFCCEQWCSTCEGLSCVICFLTQDKSGEPYTSSRWTLHIQDLFEVHSGRRVGPTHLRSAFVTYLLDGQLSTDDSWARAVASAMQHSTGYVSLI